MLGLIHFNIVAFAFVMFVISSDSDISDDLTTCSLDAVPEYAIRAARGMHAVLARDSSAPRLVIIKRLEGFWKT